MTAQQRGKRSPRMTRFRAAQERMAATRGRPLAPPGPDALFGLTDIDTKEYDHDHE